MSFDAQSVASDNTRIERIPNNPPTDIAISMYSPSVVSGVSSDYAAKNRELTVLKEDFKEEEDREEIAFEFENVDHDAAWFKNERAVNSAINIVGDPELAGRLLAKK